MTNLADLLPAGGGQNNTEFVADGNISAGAPVILTSNAKAAAIVSSAVGQSFGSATEFEAATASYIGMCYDTNHDRIILTYRDEGNSDYGTAVVLEISGTTITVGTPLVFDSTATSFHSCAFDPNNYGYVINCYRGTSNYGYMCVLYWNGSNTLSAGSTTTFDTSGNTYRINTCYFPPTQRTLVAYRDYSTGYPKGRSISLSGTTPSAGSATTIASTGTYVMDSVYDVSSGLIAYVYVNNSANVLAGNVIYVNSTTISVGTATTLQSENTDWVAISYDSVLQKNLVAYSTSASDLKGTIVTTGDSPYSISADTASDSGEQGTNLGLAFDTRAEKHGLFFRNQTTTKACFMPVTTTASGITWGSITDLDSSGQWNHNIARYDPDQQVLVNAAYEAYASASNAIAGYIAYDSTNLTSTNLLGLAPEAISDTATGTINTWGSRCESSSFLPDGLSLGTAVEVAVANSQPESITYDTNANKIVLAYQDAGASYSGYAAVGTVSGTSISFGTPVLINTVAHYYGNSCYDSTNNKVILVYSDGNNSNYLTAIVGTVSGTSISFGTPAVISSYNYADYTGCAYDTNEQKVVVAYKDKGNSNYGTGVVGTVSGTSISFGTPTAFNSSDSTPAMAVYDSNAQKVVIDYWDQGNSFYGTAVVGTVSGTSISFGSPVVYNAAQVTNLGGCFDSTNNKVVITYQDTGNSNYGTALVGTVSGTSISFGAEAVFVTAQAGWNRCVYDTNAQKVIVSTANATDTSGQLYTGTVSGTDISFGTAVTFDSDGTSQNNIAYDSSSNQVVLAYQAYSDSAKAKAVVGSFGTTPLTVTSDYYVQTDGTISTTSTSPAQLIGKAIKTNQINIKDYTG